MWREAVFIISLVSSVTCKHGFDSGYCQNPTPAPNAPTSMAKPTIPDQFSVHVECVFTNKNTTTDVHEWYDDINNRGSAYQLEGGIEFQAWYDYNTNEFIGYLPQLRQCTVQTLSTSDQRYMYGDSTIAGSQHMFSPAKALHFGSSSPEVYKGITKVRGILCDTWLSCQYWDAYDATMTVTWYFSATSVEWDTAIGQAVPVRAHVVGRVYDTDTTYHNMDHYYDFFHFRASLDDPTKFETPAGVQCPGRKNTQKLPTTPNAFSFTTEIIDKYNSRISFMTEYYDFNTKVVMYKYRPSVFDNSPFGTNDLLEIHDFNTGVAYVTDTMYGNCSVKPIEQGSFDDKSTTGQKERIRNSREFFYFDVINFTYEGVKKSRGVDCNSWVGVRPNYPPGVTGNSTWQWYFATNDWSEVNTGTLQGGTPIMMQVDSPSALWSYDYNVYNFVKSQPNILMFDISHCYINRNRRKFQLNFPGVYILEKFYGRHHEIVDKFGVSVSKMILDIFETQIVSSDYKPNVANDIETFKYFLLISLTNQLKISALRIANLQVFIDDDESDIIVTFEILDVAPIQGDVTKPITEVPLDVVSNTFMNLVKTNKFLVSTMGSSFKNLVGLVPEQNSLIETTYINSTGTSQSGSITPGVMAAVGVVMPIVGGALGGVFAYFFFK